MALTDKSSIVVPKGFYGKANVLQGFNPQTENLVDLDVVRNTTATRVNEAGLIESVAANVPRRDFLNGGCGELLVEPQRTNLITYSNDFTQWKKEVLGTGLTPIVTPNFGTHLGRNTTKVKFEIGSLDNASRSYIEKNYTDPSGASVDSVFIRSLSGTVVCTVGGSAANNTTVTPNWQRIKTNNNAGSGIRVGILDVAITTPSQVVELEIHDAQVEEGDYETSIIPTTASAVTRNQDVISATNIGSLLNDAEGGFFVNASVFSKSQDSQISLNDGTGDNRLNFYFKGSANEIQKFIVVNGSEQFSEIKNGYNKNQFYKLASRYASNDFSFYADGAEIASSTSGNTFNDSTLSNLIFSNVGGGFKFFGRIRELIVFNNAPTDSELQAITTP